MKEIDKNKEAWSKISKDHYEVFKKQFLDGTHRFNKIIQSEIGDLTGKNIIHLQCNTGADSIVLSKLGAKHVTGVDLVPDNIHYAKKLADDLGVSNVDFFQCDIMELMENHNEKYDMVFTSEGAIIWLPDLKKWGQTIRHLLKDNGIFYVFDIHPFYLTMDEEKFIENKLEIKYPYFKKIPDIDNSIGGYASERKEAVCYSWMYKVSDIINSLSSAGLFIEFFNEYDEHICDIGNMKYSDKNLFYYDYYKGKFPFSFSLKASVHK